MKRSLLIISVFYTTLFGQSLEQNIKSDWKIYGGISSMSATADSYNYSTIDPERKIGFNIGVVKSISDKASVGVGYTTRGWKDKAYWIDLGADVEEDWTISGIEIFATYDLFQVGNATLWAGPSYAILTNIEAEFKVAGQSISEDSDIDDNELSIIFGASFPIGAGDTSLNLGYQRSLIEVDNFLIFNQIFAEISFEI
tara:strand:+ start:103 stop:696 length:594 start_codon:yes stop_codon:yes gene_type:complete